MKKRVVVAMSGGVDSSVAAALLKGKGYEVVGVTMCFGIKSPKRKKAACCSAEGISDARRVAEKLGIRHYVLNFAPYLKRKVISDFLSEYAQGRTPNPCIRCNQFLKFGVLLKKALSLKAECLATGHYARIARLSNGRSILKKGSDKHKDQSYFLYRLNQSQLRHIIFPLGNYRKEEVREIAKRFDLPVATNPGSQEVCFLKDDDYRTFVKDNLGKEFHPGPIVDTKGNRLGQHRNIAFYTVGQREGLGIALGHPAYVTRIDAATNTIVVGSKEETYKKSFIVKKATFIIKLGKKKIAAKVKIRYNHQEAPAELKISKDKVTVSFKKAQFAVTPGQSAVFYHRDSVLGGGVIDRVLE